MVRWFLENYVAPDTGIYWNDNATWDDNATWRDEKEPHVPNGGPFDARETITREFSDRYNSVAISTAVKKVGEDGTTDWAPLTGLMSHDDRTKRPPVEIRDFVLQMTNEERIDQMRNAVIAAFDECNAL